MHSVAMATGGARDRRGPAPPKSTGGDSDAGAAVKKDFVLPELTPTKSALLLGLIALGYGTNNTMVKTMQENVALAPLVLCFLRMALAAVAVAPVTFMEGKLPRRVVTGGLELGLWMGGGYVLQAFALMSTSVTNVGCIFTLATVMVPLVDWCFGHPCSFPNQVACAVALLGLYLLGGGAETGLPTFVAGDLWALASTLSFAMHVVREHYWSSEVGHPTGLASMQMVGAVTVAAAAMCLDIVRIPGSIAAIVAGLPTLNWMAMCWTGMICTGLVQAGEVIALRNAQPVTAALIYNTVPLWGAWFAWMIRGDALPTGFALLGAGLIVGSGLTPFVVTWLMDRKKDMGWGAAKVAPA